MPEILFVIKSFLITCVVVYCFQFKWGEETIDQKVNNFLQKGTLTHLLKDVGQGATRLTASTYNEVSEGKFKLRFGQESIEKAEQAKQQAEEYEEKILEKLESIEKE